MDNELVTSGWDGLTFNLSPSTMKQSVILRNVCATILLFVSASGLRAQYFLPNAHPRPAGVAHQYPLSGAREVSVGTEIGIRAFDLFDPMVLTTLTAEATGSKTGQHLLAPRLTMEGNMLIFHPAKPFAYDETVTFSYSALLASGVTVHDTFTFATMLRSLKAGGGSFSEVSQWKRSGGEMPVSKKMKDGMQPQAGLPGMDIKVDNNPNHGLIYLANFGLAPGAPSNLIVTDEHGSIVRSHPVTDGSAIDFIQQDQYNRTFYNIGTGKYYRVDTATWVLNDSFAVNKTDSADFAADSTDGHDLLLFPDGSYALLGVHPVTMDLSAFGGHSSAVVGSSTIEIFNSAKDLIFHWRGIDYYSVGDMLDKTLLDKSKPRTDTVDFEHANSIDLDFGTKPGAFPDLILSNRHLSEVTDISTLTGDIRWRLGGAHNQFKLVGDSVWFEYEHDARWLPNGHLTLFDNANFDSVIGTPGYRHQSRACEYVIDTTARPMTATLFWQYHHTPETFSPAMGNVQKIYTTSSTLIGWGLDTVAMTEIDGNNNTTFEMNLLGANYTYRARKVLLPPKSVGSGQSISSTSLSIEALAPRGNIEIVYSLEKSGSVSLDVYDALGRSVRSVLNNASLEAGSHTSMLDLSSLASGSYYCVLRTEDGTVSRIVEHLR